MISSNIEKSLWARLARLCNRICNARLQRSILCTFCPFNTQFSVTQAACSLAAFLWLIVSTWHMLQLSSIPSHSPACTCNWYSCNRFFHTGSSKGNCFLSHVSKKTYQKSPTMSQAHWYSLFWDLRSQKRSWVQTLWSAAEIPASPLLMSWGCQQLVRSGLLLFLKKKAEQFL